MEPATEMHYAVFDKNGARVFSGPASEVKRYSEDHSAVPLWMLTHLERIGRDSDPNFVKDYLASRGKPACDITS